MIIHTVQPNETAASIAETYGVSTEMLMKINQLSSPDRLVAGQTLLILFPDKIHQVQEGDNLADIAVGHGSTVMELLRNNPWLSDREYIYPGEEIVIGFSDEKIMEISTNGYAFPFIDAAVLRKTLPYLTYLTIYYYRIMSDGGLVDIDEHELIDLAKAYGVAPVMLISTLTEARRTDMEANRSILSNIPTQERLINNVLEVMRTKGYYGLTVDIENILPEERQLFINFIANMSARLKEAGYTLFVTLTPNTFQTGSGEFYEGPEYASVGQFIDGAILLSYEWGNATSPQPALPLAQVRNFLDYAITQLPSDKISIGIPIIGYIWQLPFIPGSSLANAITYNSALNLALDVGTTIYHDEASEAPYFTYSLDGNYIVWFRDVRSVASLLNLMVEYNLAGIGIWNIMQFSSGLWMLINALFDIRKIDMDNN